MLVTQVQWTANSTMNIMRRRMTMEPMLVELARSLIWWAGSTEGTWEEAPLDCCFYQCVCMERRSFTFTLMMSKAFS